MKHVRGQYSIAALLVVLAVVSFVLLLLTSSGLSQVVGLEGFRSLDCKGITCEEGQFCQDNVCKAISPPYTNKYFPDGPA